MIRRPPRSTRRLTLFPYTTLFRSRSRSTFRAAPATSRPIRLPICTPARRKRSEEHTPELQSPIDISYAVFCLKKKKKKNKKNKNNKKKNKKIKKKKKKYK